MSFPRPMFCPATVLTYTSWNSSDKGTNITLSGSNLTATAGAAWEGVRGVAGKSTGKFYFEVNIDSILDQDDPRIGIGTATATRDGVNGYGSDAGGYCTLHQGASVTSLYKRNNGSNTALTSTNTYTVGQKVMVAADLTNGKLWFGYNGTWYDSGDPAAGTNAQFTGLSGTFYPMIELARSGYGVTANFGTTAFAHTKPSGFTGWVT